MTKEVLELKLEMLINSARGFELASDTDNPEDMIKWRTRINDIKGQILEWHMQNASISQSQPCSPSPAVPDDTSTPSAD